MYKLRTCAELARHSTRPDAFLVRLKILRSFSRGAQQGHITFTEGSIVNDGPKLDFSSMLLRSFMN